MLLMAQFQKLNTREPPKTKSELREMLAEAVRNTKLPDQKRAPKARLGRFQFIKPLQKNFKDAPIGLGRER